MDYKMMHGNEKEHIAYLEMELTRIDVFSDELCQKHLENGVVKNPIIRKELQKMYDREEKIKKLLNAYNGINSPPQVLKR